MSAHVILITGPRASGKSTFAAEVHRALVDSVLLHVDDPFHEVLVQDRNRWMGSEVELYAVILRHQLALARHLALEGSCVIVDGTVLPDQFALVVDNQPAPGLDIVVLLPSLEDCLTNEHRTTRTVLVREEKVAMTWRQMQTWRTVIGVSVRIVDGDEVERGKALSAVVRQLQQTL